MPHLYKLGVENFRLFKEMQEFDFAPITLFTGVNNSGKSSVIKSLLLLKESFNRSINLSALLFTESKHHLGSISQCINNEIQDEQYLKFKFQMPSEFFDKDCSIELKYKPDPNFSENGILRAFKLFHKDKEFLSAERDIKHEEAEKNEYSEPDGSLSYKINVKVDLGFILELLKTDGINQYNKTKKAKKKEHLTDAQKKEEELKIHSWEYQIETTLDHQDYLLKMNSCFNSFFTDNTNKQEKDTKLIDFNEPLFIPKDSNLGNNFSSINTISAIKNRISDLKHIGLTISFFDETDFPTLLDIYLRSHGLIATFNKIEINSDEEAVLSVLGNFIFGTVLQTSIKSSFASIQEITKNIYSLSSIRGNTERLYSNNSEIVDMNIILIKFLEANISTHGSIFNFINDSLKLFNIGDQLSIERHQGVASEIFIHRGTKKKLLADMGFGYTQLLPVILKVAIIAKENEWYKSYINIETYKPTVLLLEEPESNLHPSYQSKLADLIIDAACKFNIQFIIETHSEYLIRKLQFLVAKKEIKPQDISLYYFHEPNSIPDGEQQVKKIEIQKNGNLSDDFGSGFFDEADNLAMQLFILNKNVSN